MIVDDDGTLEADDGETVMGDEDVDNFGGIVRIDDVCDDVFDEALKDELATEEAPAATGC